MTIQFDWPPDIVRRLTDEARRKGASLGDFLLQSALSETGFTGPETRIPDERGKRTEARLRILEIQSRVRPDPEGWTSRDYINLGRR
jgi:hypothetical protein